MEIKPSFNNFLSAIVFAKKVYSLLKYGKLIRNNAVEFPTFQQSFHNNSKPFKNS